MSSQPEKDGDNKDIPGMTTRAKSQQPLISNLFNSHVNLPYRVAKATREPDSSNIYPAKENSNRSSTTSLSASLARKDALRKSRENDDKINSRENDDKIKSRENDDKINSREHDDNNSREHDDNNNLAMDGAGGVCIRLQVELNRFS